MAGLVALVFASLVRAAFIRPAGFVAGKVLFIDTEGTFRGSRIKDICERFGVDGTAVLENIAVARAHNHEMQMVSGP